MQTVQDQHALTCLKHTQVILQVRPIAAILSWSLCIEGDMEHVHVHVHVHAQDCSPPQNDSTSSIQEAGCTCTQPLKLKRIWQHRAEQGEAQPHMMGKS